MALGETAAVAVVAGVVDVVAGVEVIVVEFPVRVLVVGVVVIPIVLM